MSAPTFVLARVAVTAVTRLSPTYVRIEFGGVDLADLPEDGPWYDQRIKVIFPPPSGLLPDLGGGDADWYPRWLALPPDERGAMRTYSVRDVHGTGADRRLVVDFVLHLEPGAAGPAANWASRAEVGDEVLVLGPRAGHPSGGIEFDPGDARRLLLAADETAVPALSRILADLPAHATGTAFCEVPVAADVCELDAPPAMEVRWLPRSGDETDHQGGVVDRSVDADTAREVGCELIPAVLAHLGARIGPAADLHLDDGDHGDRSDDHVWETPTYSAAGQHLATTDGGIPGLYAWIAGESHMVTTLRRHLVRDVGVDRSQVAFMGYWRKGVAMGS